jgi:NAD(P)-dependent dehydrogenase (short-subunit alcohol dehydrogenase family)
MAAMKDQVAIVTGGTRGIGRAISQRLAELGAIPWMIYREDEEGAAEATREICAICPAARALKADVAAPGEAERVVAAVLAVHSHLEIVVNNAFRGGRPAKKVHETDPDAWSEDLTVNLGAPFRMSRAALPAMMAQSYGRLIFIGSLAMRGERGRVAYVVAKNGLVGLAKTIALEYSRNGITANVVNPGYIEAGAFLRLDPAIREAAIKRVPMARAGTSQEIAALVGHLASREAAYTSGQVIGVDGGM